MKKIPLNCRANEIRRAKQKRILKDDNPYPNPVGLNLALTDHEKGQGGARGTDWILSHLTCFDRTKHEITTKINHFCKKTNENGVKISSWKNMYVWRASFCWVSRSCLFILLTSSRRPALAFLRRLVFDALSVALPIERALPLDDDLFMTSTELRCEILN